MMHWHIAGIGAMGTLLASSFQHATHSVNLILKNQHQLATYQHSQLTVTTDQGSYVSHPHAINIEQIGNQPIQALVCCVKAYDVTSLLMRLKPNLNENSIIILVHNGLGVLDEIKIQLPHLRIIFGLSTIGAYIEQPFSARAFLDGTLYLGSIMGEFSQDEINAVNSTFQTTNVPSAWDENIHHKIWEKFSINCSINLLTALYACKNGELRQHDEKLKKITFEVAQVVSAHGFSITAADLLTRVNHVIDVTANNYSSMYQDLQHKKPTELPYLNEHLLALAMQKKIAVPFNIELIKNLLTKESKSSD